MLKWAVGVYALCIGAAFAQDLRPAFSFAAFERDPAGYVAARYPGADAPLELRHDLEAAGFRCRDAFPGEVEDIRAACEHAERLRAYCDTIWRIEIRAAGQPPEVLRGRRCKGVIAAPLRRAAYNRELYMAAGAALLGGPETE